MRRLAALLLVLLAACGNDTPASTEPVSADVTSASQQVTIGGKSISLTAETWRNMMPGDASVDRRLIVNLKLSTADGSAWPAGVSAQRAWIIKNGEAWVVTNFETGPTSSARELQLVARGGPLWASGDPVVVVVELRDTSGTTVRVKSPQTTVQFAV